MTTTDDESGDESPDAEPFQKTVAIEKTDDEQRIALGVAMVPNEIDRQGDWERPDAIQRASEGYMLRLQAGEARSGVMHAAFPGPDDIAHVENRVLDEPTQLGDREYPAGTWVVGKKVRDDRVWALVNDGVLGSFSIGGRIVEAETTRVSDLPEYVTVGEDVPDDATVRRIEAADVGEISLVDHPAVPGADVAMVKGDELEKAADALTAGVDEATEYLVEERGHDETAARQLAVVINDAADGEKGDVGWVAKARRFFGGGGDDGDIPTGSHSAAADEAEKAGRTLNAANRANAQAIHDVALTMLEASGVDTGSRKRFTDDEASSFDIASYGQSGTATADPAESGRGTTKNTTDTMSDDTETGESDETSLAEQNAEAIADLTEAVKSMMEATAADEEEETGDEAAEKTADEGTSTDQAAEETADEAAERNDEPSQAEKNAEAIAELAEKVETVAEANGVSQQADPSQTDTEKSSLEIFAEHMG